MPRATAVINENPLTLHNLGRGDIVERFNEELEKVLHNIKDPSTPSGKRSIVISISFLPNEDREEADIDVNVTSKLLPKTKYSSAIVIARGITGSIEAHEAITHTPNVNLLTDI